MLQFALSGKVVKKEKILMFMLICLFVFSHKAGLTRVCDMNTKEHELEHDMPTKCA